MSTVFISYRRQTAPGEARALFDALVARLGQGAVFMDVDSISLGRDFRSELQKTLSACDLMLVLIDKDWAAVKDEKGRIRLENAGDFVRMEIEAGLKRDIAVTPILVKGAQMPAAEELPAEIRDLAYRNCFELSYTRWESDVREMIRRLGLDVPERGEQVETDRRPIAPGEAGGGSVPAAGRTDTAEATSRGPEPLTARQPSRKPLVIAGVLGVICLGGVATWLANPSVDTTTVNLNRPQATPAQTLPAKDDRQSVADAQTKEERFEPIPFTGPAVTFNSDNQRYLVFVFYRPDRLEDARHIVGALLSAGYRSEGSGSSLNEVIAPNRNPNTTLIKTTALARPVVDEVAKVVRIAIPVKASSVMLFPEDAPLQRGNIQIDLF
jgi:TIR domain